MIVGVPKEIMPAERRVAATPETVAEYCRKGFEVAVQSGAGAGIYISDEQYREAGAGIVAGPAEIYGRADLVLKVKQPMSNRDIGRHEVDLMKADAVLIAFLHPATPSNHDVVRRLKEKGITSLTLDSIPRTVSHAQTMDALTSMSTVTGYRSVVLAAGLFPRFVPMIGTAVGATRPARFLVLGAGVVGLQAIATAKRLGGITSAVDIRPDAREQATTLGAKAVGFEVPAEIALGAGGYSKALPEEWLQKEREALDPLVRGTDIVIASALVPGERAPLLITDAMVRRMRPGSVIVDVSIDQGGNCAATRPGETIVEHEVTILGVQNIPGGLAVDATWLFSKNVLHCVEHLFPEGPGAPRFEDEIARSMLVTRGGEIVHAGTLKAMREVESAAPVGPPG